MIARPICFSLEAQVSYQAFLGALAKTGIKTRVSKGNIW
jgi:hypothetical protein